MATSKKQKLIWYLIGLSCLAITICREAGLITLNWYHTSFKCTTTTSWNDQNFKYDVEKTSREMASINDSCNYGSMRNVPVEVWCDDFLLGDTSACNHLAIFTNAANYGFLYTPLYKSFDFSATGYANGTGRFFHEHDSTVTVEGNDLSGTLSIQGSITIYGFMSARSARQYIREIIAKEFYREATTRLRQYPE